MRADPFTTLHSEIEKYITGSHCVRQAMGAAIKNFQAFNKSRGNTIDVASESDQPGIILESTGGPGNINAASNLVTMEYSFNIMIATGDQRIDSVLYPLMWAVFAAIADAIPMSGLTALTWRDKPFVTSFNLTSAIAGESDPQLNRGIKGWTAVCAVTFYLRFYKADIKAYVTGA